MNFDSFGIEYIPQVVLDKKSEINQLLTTYLENKMRKFYCISFIEYMFAGKILLNFTNIFSPNVYKKKDKIICKCFRNKYVRKSKS